MILSKHFVFIHFPKTGGTFVRRLLRDHAPDDWQVHSVQGHHTCREIPPPFRHLPRFGFIRNPYDWYVSWYHYQQQVARNAFFNTVSANGTRDFKDTLMAIFQSDLAAIFDLDGDPNPRLGGYSAYVRYMYGRDTNAIDVGRFERLREDMQSILSRLACLPATLQKAIQTSEKSNASRHRNYRSYYDRELQREVASRDREILERFDYTF